MTVGSSTVAETATTTRIAAVAAVKEEPKTIILDRDKPVAVTGAAGFVGTHTCHALARAGWKVRAIVRNPQKAAIRLAGATSDLKVGDIRDTQFLRDAFDGVGAIVHFAAIAIERPNQSYESVNTDATRLILDAATHANVDRFVHMSQNGSDSRSPFRFLKSKGVAQDLVTASKLRWTVLRPSVIVGPEDEFVNVLARLVRLSPLVYPLPGGGNARFQPIFVDDVAQAICGALDRDMTIGEMYGLGGPAPLTLRQMAERILTAMHARRALVGLPIPLIRPMVALAQRVLPNPPVTTSLLDLLEIDNAVPNNAITRTFGIMPTPFAPEELDYLRNITARDALRSFFARG